MTTDSPQPEVARNEFDRTMGSLSDRNDVLFSRESVVRDVPLWGVGAGTRTFIVQTARAKESGDYVFVECVSDGGTVRLVLPPAVIETIVRQRDSVGTRNRVLSSRRAMQERMAAGHVPTFKKSRKVKA